MMRRPGDMRCGNCVNWDITPDPTVPAGSAHEYRRCLLTGRRGDRSFGGNVVRLTSRTCSCSKWEGER